MDAGALVEGTVWATHAHGIHIGGNGVLLASVEPGARGSRRAVMIDGCRGVVIRGITVLHPQTWMLTLGGSRDVVVEGLCLIGVKTATDGIDIVGSRCVKVLNCLLVNGDDNIAIKAMDLKTQLTDCMHGEEGVDGDWTGTVEDILVEGCVCYNDHGGTAMEIGYETRTDLIHRVVFRDMDVVAVHQFGSVFGIHAGDRARVEDILWENIRVEHHYDKLIDFRVVKSRWNLDEHRGHIRNVCLRDIHVDPSPFNEGYTVSLMGGYSRRHSVRNVRIENFRLGGRPVRTADDLALFTRHAEEVLFFRPGAD
jgi:hypothetical protein